MKAYHIKSVKWTNQKETNPEGDIIWWGPNNSGYTRDITQAGIYTEEQVINHRSHHRVEVSEIVPIDAEPWEEVRIKAYEKYLEHDKKKLVEWERTLREAEKAVKIARESIQSYGDSIKELNMELAIQEKVKVN